jgi:hypothetical protein
MKNETLGYSVYGGCRNHILKVNGVGAALYKLIRYDNMAGAVRDLTFKNIFNLVNDAAPYRCVESSIYNFMRLI